MSNKVFYIECRTSDFNSRELNELIFDKVGSIYCNRISSGGYCDSYRCEDIFVHYSDGSSKEILRCFVGTFDILNAYKKREMSGAEAQYRITRLAWRDDYLASVKKVDIGEDQTTKI